ncbi:hypothetical protein B0H34DRAFT_46835 [Crassisporium funariophilum]|nr:hypothetical protein B0H34DRAFT_46835 [Crassisporium funariophilum]
MRDCSRQTDMRHTIAYSIRWRAHGRRRFPKCNCLASSRWYLYISSHSLSGRVQIDRKRETSVDERSADRGESIDVWIRTPVVPTSGPQTGTLSLSLYIRTNRVGELVRGTYNTYRHMVGYFRGLRSLNYISFVARAMFIMPLRLLHIKRSN